MSAAQNYFLMLDEQEKRATILRLFRSRVSSHGISELTGIAHAQIVRVLAEHARQKAQQ